MLRNIVRFDHLLSFLLEDSNDNINFIKSSVLDLDKAVNKFKDLSPGERRFIQDNPNSRETSAFFETNKDRYIKFVKSTTFPEWSSYYAANKSEVEVYQNRFLDLLKQVLSPEKFQIFENMRPNLESGQSQSTTPQTPQTGGQSSGGGINPRIFPAALVNPPSENRDEVLNSKIFENLRAINKLLEDNYDKIGGFHNDPASTDAKSFFATNERLLDELDKIVHDDKDTASRNVISKYKSEIKQFLDDANSEITKSGSNTFTVKNTRKIDAIKAYIDSIKGSSGASASTGSGSGVPTDNKGSKLERMINKLGGLREKYAEKISEFYDNRNSKESKDFFRQNKYILDLIQKITSSSVDEKSKEYIENNADKIVEFLEQVYSKDFIREGWELADSADEELTKSIEKQIEEIVSNIKAIDAGETPTASNQSETPAKPGAATGGAAGAAGAGVTAAGSAKATVEAAKVDAERKDLFKKYMGSYNPSSSVDQQKMELIKKALVDFENQEKVNFDPNNPDHVAKFDQLMKGVYGSQDYAKARGSRQQTSGSVQPSIGGRSDVAPKVFTKRGFFNPTYEPASQDDAATGQNLYIVDPKNPNKMVKLKQNTAAAQRIISQIPEVRRAEAVGGGQRVYRGKIAR